MKESEFREWLKKEGYDVGTINSRVSNCLRVCQFENNLDYHFESDACKTLLSKLEYSTADERALKPQKHNIPINGNIRNGTATLKQAVNLYIKFRRQSIQKEQTLEGLAERININSNVQKRSQKNEIDSYKQFLEHFSINKDDFYRFGIENTIYTPHEVAKQQWEELKAALISNKQLSIRSYGRQGSNSNLFIDLYNYIFFNENIIIDKTNNAAPRKNIQLATGYKINESIFNYQCSHIFGQTKNPLMFEAMWNICFTPKIFDPLTGHEAKGIWPNEYTKLLREAAFKRFANFIDDYNNFISKWKIEEKICDYVNSKSEKDGRLQKFKKDALLEWKKLSLD